MTELEKAILKYILDREFGLEVSSKILKRLAIATRKFSSIDGKLCIGSLSKLVDADLPNLISGRLKHHYGAFGAHPKLLGGADFVLFSQDNSSCFDLLEISFFDESLPIDILMAEKHGFTITG